jgi:RNA polymerase sigma-70 factor (ECF subfamily)
MFGLSNSEQAGDLKDEEILARSAREPWVFSVLLDRYEAAFLRRAEHILRNREDAEEVVQDTFTKIYLNAARFEPTPGASFSSWAYKILLNTAFTRYQKLLKQGQRFVNTDPEFEKLLGERANHHGFEEDKDAVARVLERLPGHLAAVLRLHYLEHWSHQDIADATGEPVGTIKARVHRAKAAFRKVAKEVGVVT